MSWWEERTAADLQRFTPRIFSFAKLLVWSGGLWIVPVTSYSIGHLAGIYFLQLYKWCSFKWVTFEFSFGRVDFTDWIHISWRFSEDVFGTDPVYLLYGVQFDPGAAVPDADEVVQAWADDAGGSADQWRDVAAVTINVADAAAGQDVPQADGAVLPTTCQNHCLEKEKRTKIIVIVTEKWSFFWNLTLTRHFSELREYLKKRPGRCRWLWFLQSDPAGWRGSTSPPGDRPDRCDNS